MNPYREIPSHDDAHRLRRRIRALERRWSIVTSARALWRSVDASAVGFALFMTMVAVVVFLVIGAAIADVRQDDACAVSCARTNLDFRNMRSGNECVCVHPRSGARSVVRSGQ